MRPGMDPNAKPFTPGAKPGLNPNANTPGARPGARPGIRPGTNNLEVVMNNKKDVHLFVETKQVKKENPLPKEVRT